MPIDVVSRRLAPSNVSQTGATVRGKFNFNLPRPDRIIGHWDAFAFSESITSEMGEVKKWACIAEEAGDLEAAATADEPSYLTNGLKTGYPSVNFYEDYLEAPDSFLNLTDFTIAWVFRANDTGIRPCFSRRSEDTTEFDIYLVPDTHPMNPGALSVFDGSARMTTYFVDDDQIHSAVINHASAGDGQWGISVDDSRTTFSSSLSGDAGECLFGAYNSSDPSNKANNLRVGEIIVWDISLGTTNISLIHDYFDDRWDL